MKNTQELKCDRCRHEWKYEGSKKSTLKIPAWVTCPNCRKNLKLPIKEA